MTNTFDVESKGLLKPSGSSIILHVAIGSLLSIVVSLAIAIPLIYSLHDNGNDCSCTSDRKAFMMSVSSSMNRAWGDYDYNTYFANADPNINMVIAEYGVDATG